MTAGSVYATLPGMNKKRLYLLAAAR